MIDTITIPGFNGNYSVQDNALINVRVLRVAREGKDFYKNDTVGNGLFSYDKSTGTISYETPFVDIEGGPYELFERNYIKFMK